MDSNDKFLCSADIGRKASASFHRVGEKTREDGKPQPSSSKGKRKKKGFYRSEGPSDNEGRCLPERMEQGAVGFGVRRKERGGYAFKQLGKRKERKEKGRLTSAPRGMLGQESRRRGAREKKGRGGESFLYRPPPRKRGERGEGRGSVLRFDLTRL